MKSNVGKFNATRSERDRYTPSIPKFNKNNIGGYYISSKTCSYGHYDFIILAVVCCYADNENSVNLTFRYDIMKDDNKYFELVPAHRTKTTNPTHARLATLAEFKSFSQRDDEVYEYLNLHHKYLDIDITKEDVKKSVRKYCLISFKDDYDFIHVLTFAFRKTHTDNEYKIYYDIIKRLLNKDNTEIDKSIEELWKEELLYGGECPSTRFLNSCLHFYSIFAIFGKIQLRTDFIKVRYITKEELKNTNSEIISTIHRKQSVDIIKQAIREYHDLITNCP